MTTFKQFAARSRARIRATRTASNPNIKHNWPGASHWDIILRGPTGETMHVVFSQGSAHKSPPRLAGVLESLASDARLADMSLKEFVSEICVVESYAAAKDAEDSYAACQRIAAGLRRVLGSEAYAELLACEE